MTQACYLALQYRKGVAFASKTLAPNVHTALPSLCLSRHMTPLW